MSFKCPSCGDEHNTFCQGKEMVNTPYLLPNRQHWGDSMLFLCSAATADTANTAGKYITVARLAALQC